MWILWMDYLQFKVFRIRAWLYQSFIMSQSQARIIGITGGICAGKSTVTEFLRDNGVTIIDADKLGHKVYEPSTPAFELLVRHFGNEIVSDDGNIDRRKLGSIVFTDKSEMRELEKIVWPEIRRLIIEEIVKGKETLSNRIDSIPVIAIEAAVMIEAGWQDLVTELWVVYVDKDEARSRLMSRNGLSAEEADRRIAAQLSNEERIQFANAVIHNNLPREELRDKVNLLLSAGPRPSS
jgi:phosphopantetheine adenylyltransferase/dephospho-CoA kinase